MVWESGACQRPPPRTRGMGDVTRRRLDLRSIPIPLNLRGFEAELTANKLHAELGVRDLPLLSALFMRTGTKVSRNDPYPCGSGKKYKKCFAVRQIAMAD